MLFSLPIFPTFSTTDLPWFSKCPPETPPRPLEGGNRSAIVVYLESSPEMPIELSWLLFSWERECLDYTFDIVAYHSKRKAASTTAAEMQVLSILKATVGGCGGE